MERTKVDARFVVEARVALVGLVKEGHVDKNTSESSIKKSGDL
jgi:hypothetical protein